MLTVILVAAFVFRVMVPPAHACICAEFGPRGGLWFPNQEEPVATDVAMFWHGTEDDAEFSLVGPDGAVPVVARWWQSGSGNDVAVVKPVLSLSANTSYELSHGDAVFSFSTGTQTTTPSPARAALERVCVDVLPEFDTMCNGTSFSFDLPALESGYYVAELTNEKGRIYTVFGTAKGVRAYRGRCYSNFDDARNWIDASARVAVVSDAGEFGPWSATFIGNVPEHGERCLAERPDGASAGGRDDAGCGCGLARPATAAATALAAGAAVWRSRRGHTGRRRSSHPG